MGWRGLVAAVDAGGWRPGIGDPTLVGWLTVAAYFLAAALCLAAASREPAPDGGPSGRASGVWTAMAALLALLGINKQLDLQSLLTVVARRGLRSLGQFPERRAYQVAFIALVALSCVATLGTALWASRRSLRHRWPAMVGLAFVLGYVAIRAASFHRVDALIASRLGGLTWNWIFELGGLAAVIVGAARVARLPRVEPRAASRLEEEPEREFDSGI